VTAAAQAGALGFVAAGYQSAQGMRAQIRAVQAATPEPFGVNVFVPGSPAPDREELARYLSALRQDAADLGAEPGEATWDDDDWPAKIADLIAAPVPVVSFTFGCPGADVIASLRAVGSSVWVTVTDPAEAAVAVAAGADGLCVQGTEAGAHRGTFANATGTYPNATGVLELVSAIHGQTSLPLVAAGGIMNGDGAAAALAAGATAVQCGTAFLRCPESGAHKAHKDALGDPRFTATAVTRSFSGRPARGLVNSFMLEHAAAPAAYPEVNNATRPLRAAAARARDADRMSLWAGEGFRSATSRPAGEVVELLCPST
jgi:nitronate monooxygenase